MTCRCPGLDVCEAHTTITLNTPCDVETLSVLSVIMSSRMGHVASDPSPILNAQREGELRPSHGNLCSLCGDMCMTSIEQNVKKQYFLFLLENMKPKGKETISALMRDKRMYPGRDKQLRDLSGSGALASCTGMELWQLASIMLVLFRPGLSSVHWMVRTSGLRVRGSATNVLPPLRNLPCAIVHGR